MFLLNQVFYCESLSEKTLWFVLFLLFSSDDEKMRLPFYWRLNSFHEAKCGNIPHKSHIFFLTKCIFFPACNHSWFVWNKQSIMGSCLFVFPCFPRVSVFPCLRTCMSVSVYPYIRVWFYAYLKWTLGSDVRILRICERGEAAWMRGLRAVWKSLNRKSWGRESVGSRWSGNPKIWESRFILS